MTQSIKIALKIIALVAMISSFIYSAWPEKQITHKAIHYGVCCDSKGRGAVK